MDHDVVEVIEVVLFRGRSDVPISIPVALENAIDGCEEDKAADVKFSIFYSISAQIVQETVLQILLKNHCPFFVMLGILIQSFSQLLYDFILFPHHFDSVPPVRVLPRLAYPNVSIIFL